MVSLFLAVIVNELDWCDCRRCNDDSVLLRLVGSITYNKSLSLISECVLISFYSGVGG